MRGDVPEPAIVPNQIIENGYDGVYGMIESMWPDALKAVSTTLDQAPNGWEHVPREPRVDGSSESEIVSEAANSSETPSASTPAKRTQQQDSRPLELARRINEILGCRCHLKTSSARIVCSFYRQDEMRQVLADSGLCLPRPKRRPASKPDLRKFTISVRLPKDWRVTTQS